MTTRWGRCLESTLDLLLSLSVAELCSLVKCDAFVIDLEDERISSVEVCGLLLTLKVDYTYA